MGHSEDLDLLKYPIGKCDGLPAATAEERRAQIVVIRELPRKLREVTDGLTELQLDTPYREGGWMVRQVVHHLADSHANALVRFKLSLTEEWPVIKPYLEGEWAKLADSRLPVGVSLDLLTALHVRWATVLEAVSDADFSGRGYMHPELGRQSLGQALTLYDWHSRHHVEHVAALRRREGW